MRVFQTIESETRRGRMLALVGFLGLSLLVMLVSGSSTASSVGTWYPTLRQPPGAPPNWVFGPVWTVLYLMIGVAGWLVWARVAASAAGKRAALRWWGWQLLVNAFWPVAFFGLRLPGLALAVILVLLGLIGVTMRRFAAVRPAAAWLLVPYLLWVAYATYLNAGLWWLNR